jgi:hypothetical protein
MSGKKTSIPAPAAVPHGMLVFFAMFFFRLS